MNFKSLILAAFFVVASPLPGFAASDAFLEAERDRADQLFVSIAASPDWEGNPRGENDREAKIENMKSRMISVALRRGGEKELETMRKLVIADVNAWKKCEQARAQIEHITRELTTMKKMTKEYRDAANNAIKSSLKFLDVSLECREKIWHVK